MESKNGHDPKHRATFEDGPDGRIRVILYIRVSTDEQAEFGYSVDGQLAELQAHAENERFVVVAIIEDPGEKRWTLDRQGIHEMREIVSTTHVDEIWAWAWDRYGQSPWPEVLAIEMEGYGVTLRSLDDGGEGEDAELMRGLKSLLSTQEQRRRVKRSRMGKLAKARAGKVVGGHTRAYGFQYVKEPDHKGNLKVVGYAVDEAEMQTVRRIFSEVASGTGIRTIKEQLDRERVPTPGRGTSWNRQFLRDLIPDDLYKPHIVDELRELGVSDAVLGTLDADSLYGVYRYEGIPVPVPDAGIPLEVVREARYRIKNNLPTPPNEDERVWELAGGILFCSECGRRMQKYPHPRGYEYYRCQATMSGKADRCTQRKVIPAAKIEQEV